MTRSRQRIVAGVCAGLADHLGWKVTWVRWGMIVASLIFGMGAVFYAWLWVLVPDDAPGLAEPRSRQPAGQARTAGQPRTAGRSQSAGQAEISVPRVGGESTPEPAAGIEEPRVFTEARRILAVRGGRQVLVGAVVLVVAGLLLSQLFGIGGNLGALLPLVVIVVGAALVWLQLDASRRALLLGPAQWGTKRNPWAALRLGLGLLLVVVGFIVIAVGGGGWDQLLSAVGAALAVLIGVGLVLAPWAVRIWRDLQEERSGRVREAERAEIAAHLHDSVLQTLALIQRRAGNEHAVVTLARAQERELREWIYRDASRGPEHLAARITAAAAEVEELHTTGVDVVVVGDTAMDARVEALVQGAREAMLNAARHSGTTVSVYLEANAELAEVFIRDRGSGFDLAAVPADRLGVRESIIGRMRRHGGTAMISSGPEGTEVRLALPLRPADPSEVQDPPAVDAAAAETSRDPREAP